MDKAQEVWLAMLSLSCAMADYPRNSPEHADMATSMSDLRVARLTAKGVSPDTLDANGYPNATDQDSQAIVNRQASPGH